MNDCVVQGGISGSHSGGYGNRSVFLNSSGTTRTTAAPAVVQILRKHILREIIVTHALPHRVHQDSHAKQHDLTGSCRRLVARARHLQLEKDGDEWFGLWRIVRERIGSLSVSAKGYRGGRAVVDREPEERRLRGEEKVSLSIISSATMNCEIEAFVVCVCRYDTWTCMDGLSFLS